AGRLARFEKDYVTCGITWELWGLAKGAIGNMGSGESLAWREGKNAQVPYSWNVGAAPDGSEYVAPNCLQCHGGHFGGQLMPRRRAGSPGTCGRPPGGRSAPWAGAPRCPGARASTPRCHTAGTSSPRPTAASTSRPTVFSAMAVTLTAS